MNTLARMAQLRRYVQEHDLPQEKLAQQIGISYSWLTKFARGELTNPRVRTLEKIERHQRRQSRR